MHPRCSLLALAATLASAVLPTDHSVAGASPTCGNGVGEGTEECDDGNTTSGDGDTVVARYHASPTADQADPLSEQLVFSVHQPFANHNGGLNLFGPDGMLYVGMGDGGSGGDPMGNGQSDASNLGKLLRVDVSTLPATPQRFAKGLRNPWRYSFDRATGDLYVADVGQNLFEEIDFVPAASLTSGRNYGWDS